MITDFDELRKFLSNAYPVDLNTQSRHDRVQYIQTMAMIQIAQELNEIKVFLSIIGPHIEKIANPLEPLTKVGE